MNRSYMNRIVSGYGLRTRKIDPCHSLYKQAAAYRIKTRNGDYLVKPFHGTARRLKRIVRSMRRLKKAGFSHLPAWKKNRKGAYWVKAGNRFYYLTEWVDGTTLPMEAPAFQALGRALGRLHRVKAGSSRINSLAGLKKQSDAFHRHLADLRKQGTEDGKWFAEKGDQCLSLSRQSWKDLRLSRAARILRKEQKRPSLIHGDVTLPNLLMKGKRLYLIDWERVRPGNSYLELAKALANTTGFSTPLMEALLEGYTSKRSLSRPERHIVAALFRFPREAWYAAKETAAGRPSHLLEIVRSSWDRRLAAISWIDAWAGRK